jgi:hypothetical protein
MLFFGIQMESGSLILPLTDAGDRLDGVWVGISRTPLPPVTNP